MSGIVSDGSAQADTPRIRAHKKIKMLNFLGFIINFFLEDSMTFSVTYLGAVSPVITVRLSLILSLTISLNFRLFFWLLFGSFGGQVFTLKHTHTFKRNFHWYINTFRKLVSFLFQSMFHFYIAWNFSQKFGQTSVNFSRTSLIFLQTPLKTSPNFSLIFSIQLITICSNVSLYTD